MPLHLVKLCVGVDSLEDYEGWCEERWRSREAAQAETGELPRLWHVTRMVPRRGREVIGNSLYWVIRGQIQARQRIDALEPFEDADGVRRCRIVLDRTVVPTEWKRKRAFQGWRYLQGRAAPPDLPEGAVGLDPRLRRELADLGLL